MAQSRWVRFVGVVALAGLPTGASAGPPATAPPAPAATAAPAAAAEKVPGLDQEALRNQALSALDRDDPAGCASLAAEGVKLSGRYREELFGLQGTCLDNAGMPRARSRPILKGCAASPPRPRCTTTSR